MSAELQYTIHDDGSVSFAASMHRYRVRRFARGMPAITLISPDGSVLTSDRFDLFDARARIKFANSTSADASTVIAELMTLAELVVDDGPPHDAADDSDDIPYEATPAGLVWKKPLAGGAVSTPLTNFTAIIVGDVLKDDGVETIRAFDLEVRLNGRTHRFSLPSERFSGMGWVTGELGASALLYPGPAIRDHARAAIQLLSPPVPERRVFAHIGWRDLDGQWVYLHAGGAIGRDGIVDGITVEVPDALSRFVLPHPVNGQELVTAIHASLGMIEVLPLEVTVPIFAAIWRAVIGEADFSLHLAGSSGEGKSELTALAQQHWGAGLDSRHLPGSWSSTGNALEGLTFAAKDALTSIDDFVPTGTPHDAARLHKDADRVFRAQGNRSSRLRMRVTSQGVQLQAPKPPRGLILSTGEDIPKGQSLRGRMLILEVPRGLMDWHLMTQCQNDAAAGRYSQALVGFVRFVAEGRVQRLVKFKASVEVYRAKAYRAGGHRRTPEIVANLAAALDVFLTYAVEVTALTKVEADTLRERWWRALGVAAAAQPGHQLVTEPIWQFRTYLASAISSGEAHIADLQGNAPTSPRAWGWRLVTVGSGEHQRDEWRPQGKRVGWIDDTDDSVQFYLEPEASFGVAQDVARRTGDGIANTSGVLRKRLKERGLLASTDGARTTLTVRRVIEGGQKTVLHVVPTLLEGEGAKKSDISDSEEASSGKTDDQEHSGTSESEADDAETGDPDADRTGNVGNVGFSQPPLPYDVQTHPTTLNGRCRGCEEPLPPDLTDYCRSCERLIKGERRR